jgi:medium-chain acyl-[acyl-carrier-protein] hydrolase
MMTRPSRNDVQETTPWLASSGSNPGASLRVFCFPYAGGGASTFHSWSRTLPPSVEVCPVQLPGRERRVKEPPFTRLSDLVQAISQALAPHMDKPFVLYGHSMGGLLGFELARLLRKQGGPQPLHFFVSGCRGPQVIDRERITYNLPEAELLDELRTLSGTPEEVLENPELMQVLLPILRADFEVVETYEYAAEPPLSMPISAFGGLQDEKIERDHLEAWSEQTTAVCKVRMLPGNHFFLRTAQRDLLHVIERELLMIVESIGKRNSP